MGSQLGKLSSSELAALLKKFGSKNASAEVVERIVREGNLANADGTISYLKFAAYLAGRRNGKFQ